MEQMRLTHHIIQLVSNTYSTLHQSLNALFDVSPIFRIARLLAASSGHRDLIQRNWPQQIPVRLPTGMPRLITVNSDGQALPAIVLGREDVQVMVAGMQQREELKRAESVYQEFESAQFDQLDIVCERLDATAEKINQLKDEIGGDQSESGSEVYQSTVQRKRERIDALQERMSHGKSYLEHGEKELDIWRDALLVLYRKAVITQREADARIKDQLQTQGALEFNAERFFETWQRLPAWYRSTRPLQKQFEEYRMAVDRPDASLADVQLWSSFRHEQDDRWQAYCRYEAAAIDLNVAEKELRRFGQDALAMEEGWRKARFAGRDLITPSQFAADCISERRRAIHALVEAKNNMYRATKDVEMWDHVSELNSNALLESNSPSNPSTVEYHAFRQSMLPGTTRQGRIQAWREATSPEPGTGWSSIESQTSRAMDDDMELVAIEDAVSVAEERRYERIRRKEWQNTQLARDETLRARTRAEAVTDTTKTPEAEQSKALMKTRRLEFERTQKMIRKRGRSDSASQSSSGSRRTTSDLSDSSHPSKRQR